MRRGQFRFGSIYGAPVFVHWSLPLAVVLTFFLLPLWAALITTVLAHECGHAALVRRYRLQVTGIEIHLFGGRCHFTAPANEMQRSAIAWGGILGQAAVVAAVVAAWFALPGLHGAVGEDLLTMMIGVNVVVALVNLAPIAPLDGREAWPYFRHVARRLRRERLERRSAALASELAALRSEPTEPGPRDLH